MRIRKLTLATLACLLLWTVTAAATPAQKEYQMLKVGKKGEVTLTKPTKVDGITLQPDTYVIQHRVSGSHHFVRFVELKQVEAEPPTELPYTYTEADKAGEIKCKVVPAPGPIEETTAYIVTVHGVQRITKVAIKGENVFHVFPVR